MYKTRCQVTINFRTDPLLHFNSHVPLTPLRLLIVRLHNNNPEGIYKGKCGAGSFYLRHVARCIALLIELQGTVHIDLLKK